MQEKNLLVMVLNQGIQKTPKTEPLVMSYFGRRALSKIIPQSLWDNLSRDAKRSNIDEADNSYVMVSDNLNVTHDNYLQFYLS